MTESNEVTNKGKDQVYFTVSPRLVWALSRDPYDYTLWGVIKDVAGEEGKCYLSTPQLATLAMMSEGKVQDCRAYLIQAGLLRGELRRDPGYPQPVWHMAIPDIWAKSFKWAEEHSSMQERIDYKKVQAEAKKEHSCGERSKEHSCGEKGGAPGEKGGAPGETKKNHKEEPKEKPKESARFSENFSTPEALLEAIKKTVKPAFDQTNWQRKIQPLWVHEYDPDDSLIILGLENEPACDWLNARARGQFGQAARGLTNRNFNFTFKTLDRPA
jgi:hypothetical protein